MARLGITMGVKLGRLVKGEVHSLELLSRQRVVIDGSYVIIAALKKIRPNGRAFVNRWGEPLAPIHGIFYNALRFLEAGIRPMLDPNVVFHLFVNIPALRTSHKSHHLHTFSKFVTCSKCQQ